MIRPRGFGVGPQGPTPEEIEREAAAELRRAMAGAGPRNGFPGADAMARREPPPVADRSEWSNELTPEEERRAITELAMQQLTERPYGSIRASDTIKPSAPLPAGVSPEDMRNRALADVLEKQRRMAQERPAPPQNRERPATGQRTSGVTISPQLTVAPTLTGSRSPLPAAIQARGAPRIPVAPPGNGTFPGRDVPVADRPRVRPKQLGASLRRAVGRPTETPVDGETSWHALAELADLLAGEVYPSDSFPAVAEWLASLVSSTVAIMLFTHDTVDQVVAWPDNDATAADLLAVAGHPIDRRSSIWEAVCDGSPLMGEARDPIVMPEGVSAAGIGAWLVVPIADRGMAFGALIVLHDGDDPFPDHVAPLVSDVAPRIARALYNCEEAASGAEESALPAAIRDRLGAIALVLEAVESLPLPPVTPELDRQYENFSREAAQLQAELLRFLGRPSVA